MRRVSIAFALGLCAMSFANHFRTWLTTDGLQSWIAFAFATVLLTCVVIQVVGIAEEVIRPSEDE